MKTIPIDVIRLFKDLPDNRPFSVTIHTDGKGHWKFEKGETQAVGKPSEHVNVEDLLDKLSLGL